MVCASKRMAVLTLMELADMWGLCRMAASIFSVDHDGPLLTVNNSVESDCRRGFTRWWVEYVRSHMSPISPILSLVFNSSGIELSLLIYCFSDILRCWNVWAKESECVVDGSFRLGPFSVFGTDVMYLSKVWNSTGWKFDGFQVVGLMVPRRL